MTKEEYKTSIRQEKFDKRLKYIMEAIAVGSTAYTQDYLIEQVKLLCNVVEQQNLTIPDEVKNFMIMT